MWFWLFVIIMMVGISLIIVGNMDWNREKNEFLYYHDSDIKATGWGISIISGVACIILLFLIIDAHTNVEASLEKSREIFGFLSKEVIDEVQDWNKEVRYVQAAQDDFWVGIFYPNVYDEFETIDYESYNTGE